MLERMSAQVEHLVRYQTTSRHFLGPLIGMMVGQFGIHIHDIDKIRDYTRLHEIFDQVKSKFCLHLTQNLNLFVA